MKTKTCARFLLSCVLAFVIVFVGSQILSYAQFPCPQCCTTSSRWSNGPHTYFIFSRDVAGMTRSSISNASSPATPVDNTRRDKYLDGNHICVCGGGDNYPCPNGGGGYYDSNVFGNYNTECKEAG